MKLVRFVAGLIVAITGLTVFVLTGKPRDDIAELRPYITSERSRYLIGHRSAGAPLPAYERTMQMHGLTMIRLSSIMAVHPGDNHAFSYSLDYSGGRRSFKNVDSVTYWRQLSWKEWLYARISSFGRDPF